LIAAIYPDIDKYEEEVTCIFHLELKKIIYLNKKLINKVIGIGFA
jgi:hypothetical protein